MKKGLFNSKTKIYRAWQSLKTRCTNPNADNYKRYGGKGTRFCEGFKSFNQFVKIIGEPPTEKHSVDRIKSKMHYSCGKCVECKSKKWRMNVKWSTPKEQASNRGRFINIITYKGETHNLQEWADKLGIPRPTLNGRINTYKWSVHKSLTTPIRTREHQYSGKTRHQLAELSGITYNTIVSRLNVAKWSIDKTLSTPVRKSNRIYKNKKQ